MKKTLIITISAVIITAAVSFIFFSKTETELINMIPFLRKTQATGILSITTPNGIATVEVDDKVEGDSPITLEELEPGTHKVKLTRKTTQEESFYDEHIYYVSIEPNTESIVNIEIGPGDNVHGYVLYYEEASTESGKGTVSVSGLPDGIQIKIEGEYKGNAPYFSEQMSEGEYRLKFINDRFESLEFPVNIVDGYNLNITSYLMPVPINIQRGANVNEEE